MMIALRFGIAALISGVILRKHLRGLTRGQVLMGLLVGWLAFWVGEGWTQHGRLFFATGVLGGFTTFSAFSLEVTAMAERGAYATALAYVLISVTISVAAVFAGLALVRASI